MKPAIPRSNFRLRPFPKSSALLLVVAACCLASASLRAAPPSATPTPNSSKSGLTIIPLGRGHFNRLCLAATVEGIKGLMILDTGASNTVLSESKYGSLRPGPTRKLPHGTPATVSINGARSPVTVVHDFHVAGTDLGASLVSLAPRRFFFDEAYEEDRQYDGLLGRIFCAAFKP